MKGIVLAGGSGSRLYPITKAVSKQLLPIYDKPMVYFPVSVLMLAGIRDILIITTPEDSDAFKRLLGDGSSFGVRFEYAVQPRPEGLAQAFIIGEEFLDGNDVCLVLGDNVFHGGRFSEYLRTGITNANGTNGLVPSATVFGYYVTDPRRYGVAEIGSSGEVLSIEEKPEVPKSNYAIPGIYFYPSDVVNKAKQITPSVRGELEITSLNQIYLSEHRLSIVTLPRGFTWLDTGTFDSLSDASNYVETIEKRTGLQIACLEEIGFNQGWLTIDKLKQSLGTLGKNSYRDYIEDLIERGGS